MTYIIGVTGGIGSGKTAVSDRFGERGITVVDADIASRAVVEPGRPALSAIAEHFGDEVISPNGSLDRALLRQKVFADEAERKWLEQLTHPLIRDEIINGLEQATSPYALLVSPLLVESGQSELTQRILVIDVDEAVQLKRTMARDDNPEAQVKAIMAAQASRETRLDYADDVIHNSGSLDDLDQQIEQLHQQYLQLATPN
jgi:dephospho-CoA kinase